MNFNAINRGGNSAQAPTYIQTALSPAAAAARRPEVQTDTEIDTLLKELSKVLDESAEAQDPEKVKALLSALSADPAERTSGDGVLSPELIALLSGVSDSAEGNGQLEAFRDLLREYVAVRWALSELDALGRITAENAARADYHLRQIEQATAFLQQLEVAISRRLDKMVAQTSYLNWRLIYRDELETKRDLEDEVIPTSRSLPTGVDVLSLVAQLLEDAPRPDLDHVSQILQQLSNQAPPEALPDVAPYDPYH